MSESATLSEYVTSAEAITIVDVPLRTFHNWVVTRRITPAMKLPGTTGAYLFARAEVEALAASRGAK